jgi:hypothetical protein
MGEDIVFSNNLTGSRTMTDTILTEEFEVVRTQSIDVVISGLMDLNDQRATHIAELRKFFSDMRERKAKRGDLPVKWRDSLKLSIGYKMNGQILSCNIFKMKMRIEWVEDHFEVSFLKGHKWTAEFIATMAMMTLLMTSEDDLEEYTEKLIKKASRSATIMLQARACMLPV